jgi:hypothetical protein
MFSYFKLMIGITDRYIFFLYVCEHFNYPSLPKPIFFYASTLIPIYYLIYLIVVIRGVSFLNYYIPPVNVSCTSDIYIIFSPLFSGFLFG